MPFALEHAQSLFIASLLQLPEQYERDYLNEYEEYCVLEDVE